MSASAANPLSAKVISWQSHGLFKLYCCIPRYSVRTVILLQPVPTVGVEVSSLVLGDNEARFPRIRSKRTVCCCGSAACPGCA